MEVGLAVKTSDGSTFTHTQYAFSEDGQIEFETVYNRTDYGVCYTLK